MILKLIIFAIVAGSIYRFFGGKIPLIDKPLRPKKKEEHDFGEIEATSACASCGMYVTEDDALIYHKKSYCSNACLEQSKK
jgi:hypothetical protein